MKKGIFLVFTAIVILLAVSCRGDKPSFTINGEIGAEEFEGCTIFLGVIDSGDTIDSTVVKEGKFQFRGTLDKPLMGRIFAESQKSGLLCESTLVLESGKIYIDLKTDSLSGTPLNDLYYSTYTANPTTIEWTSRLEECLNRYYAAETPEEQAEAVAAYREADSGYNAHMLDISRKVYRNNMKNILGAYALTQIVSFDGITYDSLDYLMKHASAIVADYEPLRKARTQLFHLANTSEGKHYADVQGLDFATGKRAMLSQLIDTNYVTLVDFWASWCSPCRQEISDNLNRLYEEYHDKGLNIIGVDVWDKVADHKEAVQKLGIAYPQLIDTTRTATETYGIDGIPTILLLDHQGTIVKRGLRGSDIEAAVVEALEGGKD
ncbi:MAG: AhpC/TSA family protein [Bacteroidales bacterium]|nr:AhpC/TSA family protein [Bacteroidales bacterium]